MAEVTTRDEYEKLIRLADRGEYPRVLTTDGKILEHEFAHYFEQWRAAHTIIASMQSSDDWPSFSQATRRRRAIRRAGCMCEECKGKWI